MQRVPTNAPNKGVTEMTTVSEMPKAGDHVTIHRRPGYKLVQERPLDCRRIGGCRCGECDGTPREYPGTVRRVAWYADNSIEAYVDCDDGVSRTMQIKPPSGDVC